MHFKSSSLCRWSNKKIDLLRHTNIDTSMCNNIFIHINITTRNIFIWITLYAFLLYILFYFIYITKYKFQNYKCVLTLFQRVIFHVRSYSSWIWLIIMCYLSCKKLFKWKRGIRKVSERRVVVKREVVQSCDRVPV